MPIDLGSWSAPQAAAAPATPARKPLDVPAIAGIPQPAQTWQEVASCITPRRAGQILRAARQGDAEAYLTLAEEIEERDLHYSSQLQTRKLAVAGVEATIEPGRVRAQTTRGTPPRAQQTLAQRIAEDFEETVLHEPYFAEALFDLMDALGKGYSVLQPNWISSEGQWTYGPGVRPSGEERGALEWIDPRLFVFDSASLRTLRMRSVSNPDGEPFPPGAFIVHYPKIKTGVRIRGGLAMLATIAHVAKSYALADWLAFCEVYGMPLRIGKYDPDTMTQKEIDQLKISIANIGHDAAALIPRNSEIEILDGRRPTSGDNVFQSLAEFWDKQLSKAIVGQTMTADDGSSLAQAAVHNEVRLDLRRADARSLEATVTAQIIKPWARWNYGDTAPVPVFELNVEPPEDLKTFTEAALPWVERGGLKVKASQIRERFNLDAPEGDEDAILEGAPAPTGPQPTPRPAPGQ
jgi:phage gp29-like protein